MRPVQSRFSRRLLLVSALVLSALTPTVLLAPPASAYNWWCSDAFMNPNYIDRCFVHTYDYQDYWYAEMTAMENAECVWGTQHTYASVRVRLYGDWQPGKFHLRQFSLRYLSGTQPWLYIRINVYDGNGNSVDRDWNAKGNWIRNDGAGRDVDNTINLSAPDSYAPVFGPYPIRFEINGVEASGPAFPTTGGECYAGPWYVQVQESDVS